MKQPPYSAHRFNDVHSRHGHESKQGQAVGVTKALASKSSKRGLTCTVLNFERDFMRTVRDCYRSYPQRVMQPTQQSKSENSRRSRSPHAVIQIPEYHIDCAPAMNSGDLFGGKFLANEVCFNSVCQLVPTPAPINFWTVHSKVMWSRYRKWKHAIAPLLLAFAYFLLRNSAEGSITWYAGLISACAVAAAYVIEEIVWWVQGRGRPCVNCGHRIRMKSFGVHNTCPKCGAQL